MAVPLSRRKPVTELEVDLAFLRDVRRLLKRAIKRLDNREKALLRMRKADGPGRAGSDEERAVLRETLEACAAITAVAAPADPDEEALELDDDGAAL